MNKFLVTLVGAFSVMACCAASAQDVGSASVVVDTSAVDVLPWYVSGKVGVALPGTIESKSTTMFGVGGSGKSTFDAGFAGAVAVGKYLTPQVRAELELALAGNAGRSFTGTDAFGGASSGTLTGNVTTTTFMVIGYYDFPQFGAFVPYLSGGLGLAHVTSDLTYKQTSPGFSMMDGTITGTDLVAAARIGAGFEYNVTDNLSVTADYTALFGGDTTFTHKGFGDSAVTSPFMAHALAGGLKGTF